MAVLGKHAVMQQLLAEGTQYVFGNPGSTELAFMDGLQDYPELEYILGLHETVPLAMADVRPRHAQARRRQRSHRARPRQRHEHDLQRPQERLAARCYSRPAGHPLHRHRAPALR